MVQGLDRYRCTLMMQAEDDQMGILQAFRNNLDYGQQSNFSMCDIQ